MSFEPLSPPYVSPTLVRAEYFYPRQDAETLRRAMKGIGTDEKTIIAILTERTNQQRVQIAEEFKTSYDKDLIKCLKSELSGDFRDLVVAAMTPIPDLLAREVYFALNSVPANVETIAEILCTHCNAWINNITSSYQKIFNMPMERAIRSCTALPGDVPKLLGLLCRAERSEDPHIDEDMVTADANALVSAGGRFLGEHSKLTNILTLRNYPQLRRTFLEYEKITGKPFDDTLRSEFTGNEEKAMITIVNALRNSAEYLASRFHASMAGLGTNERSLNRLIVVRAELDLGDIKEAFVVKYKKSLASFVEDPQRERKLQNPYFWWCIIFCRVWSCPLTCSRLQGDTSGDYKRMLVALLK